MKTVADPSTAMAKKLWVRPLLTKTAADPKNEYVRYYTSSLGVTERSTVVGAQAHHGGGSSGEAEYLDISSEENGDGKDDDIADNAPEPLLRLQQDRHSRQMNMVHTNLVGPVTFPPSETYLPQRIQCSTSFELAAVSYDSKLYSYGGAVKRVWFPVGGNEWDSEDVMLCQASCCEKCGPKGFHTNPLAGRSLTLGLPFVHRGRDCSSRDVPTVILTRRDDGFSFHREVRGIKTVEFKPALEPAEDDDPADKLINGYSSFDPAIPQVLEKKVVKFGQWDAQEAAVCVPSECRKCATPKIEMDNGEESEEEE